MNPSSLEHKIKSLVFYLRTDGSNWTGGLQYYVNLIKAAQAADTGNELELILLRAPEIKTSKVGEIEGLVSRVWDVPPESTWARLWHMETSQRLQNKTGLWLEPETSLSRMLRSRGAGAVFSTMPFGRNFHVPIIGWVPDFQHLHLPEMFSEQEVAARNKGIETLAAQAERVMLSSRSAYDDFVRLFPQYQMKASVVSFVVPITDDAYLSDPAEVCEVYHLPQRFFYLPNQLWKHKNHTVVLDALRLLRPKLPEVVVVCSGNLNDNRNPFYGGEFFTRISEYGLRENFITLGLVPRQHLYMLMRQSLALLQPSLFEGWSTTVEEAKSLGKKLILSDLPVHREQNPPESLFFDPRNPQELADLLEKVYREGKPGPDQELEEVARSQLSIRMAKYGECFLQVVYGN